MPGFAFSLCRILGFLCFTGGGELLDDILVFIIFRQIFLSTQTDMPQKLEADPVVIDVSPFGVWFPLDKPSHEETPQNETGIYAADEINCCPRDWSEISDN